MSKWINPKLTTRWHFDVYWVWSDALTEYWEMEGCYLCFNQAKELALDVQKSIKKGFVVVMKVARRSEEIKRLKPKKK